MLKREKIWTFQQSRQYLISGLSFFFGKMRAQIINGEGTCLRIDSLKVNEYLFLSENSALFWCIYFCFQRFFRSILSELFCKKGAQENTLARASFLNKVATLLKIRHWHNCFPVNFAKFLKTPFFIEHLRWLLIFVSSVCQKT